MTHTLGIIGGMSWTSTTVYYRELNLAYQRSRGGLHSAPLLLWSFDFAEIEAMQSAGDWDAMAERLGDVGRKLVGAGADALLIATNTMHKVAESVEATAGRSVLHIADAVGEAIRQRGLSTVGLLGTRFTMSETFYSGRLRQRFGIDVVTPDETDRAAIDRIIYDELCRDLIRDESREVLRSVVSRLGERGAQGVVLGCTELPLLLDDGEWALPTFDTTATHVEAVARWWDKPPGP